MRVADQVLYRAKGAGKSKWAFKVVPTQGEGGLGAAP